MYCIAGWGGYFNILKIKELACGRQDDALRLPASLRDMTDHPWSASHFFSTARRSNQEGPLSGQLTDPILLAPC